MLRHTPNYPHEAHEAVITTGAAVYFNVMYIYELAGPLY